MRGGVTPFWFEATCRCWVTSWRVAWLKLLQVSSMLWPCQQRKHEDWVGLPTFHASSIFNEVLSKPPPSRLQSWWSYDPALVVLHDGIWDASINSVFGCPRSDDFCIFLLFFAWLYILKIKDLESATPLRPAGVHCFQLPSRLPVAASACRDTEHQQFRVIFPLPRRMRSSFNALMNKGPEDNFMFTTILLLSISVYMGVAFKDIAVIKMIKGLGFLLELNWVYVDNKCRWNQNRSIWCGACGARCHTGCVHHVALRRHEKLGIKSQNCQVRGNFHRFSKFSRRMHFKIFQVSQVHLPGSVLYKPQRTNPFEEEMCLALQPCTVRLQPFVVDFCQWITDSHWRDWQRQRWYQRPNESGSQKARQTDAYLDQPRSMSKGYDEESFLSNGAVRDLTCILHHFAQAKRELAVCALCYSTELWIGSTAVLAYFVCFSLLNAKALSLTSLRPRWSWWSQVSSRVHLPWWCTTTSSDQIR